MRAYCKVCNRKLKTQYPELETLGYYRSMQDEALKNAYCREHGKGKDPSEIIIDDLEVDI